MALDRDDYSVAVAVIEAANRLQAERDEQLAALTGAETARYLAPLIRRLVHALARAMSR